MAVTVTPSSEFAAGPANELFDGPYGAYDMLPNGQSFVIVKERSAGDAPTRINLVLNWFEEVKLLAAGVTPSGSTR